MSPARPVRLGLCFLAAAVSGASAGEASNASNASAVTIATKAANVSNASEVATNAPSIDVGTQASLSATATQSLMPAQPTAGAEGLMPQPAAGMGLYNCDLEYEVWETAWTPEWKEWCCKHKNRGCPATTTTTETSTTMTSTTSTVSTSTVSTTTTTPLRGCDALCWYKGDTSSCRQRIQWASTHKEHGTANEVAPCEAAQVLVISQCEMCGECELKDAQCTVKPKHPAHHFRQRFEIPVPSSVANRDVGVSSALSWAAPLGGCVLFVASAVLMVRGGGTLGRAPRRGVWQRAVVVDAQEYLRGDAQESGELSEEL